MNLYTLSTNKYNISLYWATDDPDIQVFCADGSRIEIALIAKSVNRTREKAKKSVARLATIFLSLVALAQLLRLVLRVEVPAGGVSIPLWVSVRACVVTGGLAILVWRESKQ